MAQVGRISGPLLQDNLLRNGSNLAFRNDLNATQLLLVDVNTGRIGINTATPNFELEVEGTTQTTNLKVEQTTTLPEYTISNSTISRFGDINLASGNAVVMATMENGTIRISDNIISTIDSNANIDLMPEETSLTEIFNGLEVFGNLYTPGNITFDGSITLGDDIDQDTVHLDQKSHQVLYQTKMIHTILVVKINNGSIFIQIL